MKLFSLACAILIPAASALAAVDARSEDWASHLEVTAERRDGGAVHVVVSGREGWFVNTQFPLKITLNAPDGVKLGRKELGKGDGTLEGVKEGKAKKIVFDVPAEGGAGKAVDGSYKLVICSETSCSPPIKGTFKAAAR